MLTERIATWIALFELADKLTGTSWRVDTKAAKRAGKVFDLLAQQEHSLSPEEREQARRLLHHRHGWELPSPLILSAGSSAAVAPASSLVSLPRFLEAHPYN